MSFWTLPGLWRRGHGLFAALVCGLCLSAFAVACVTDLSHPPGVRSVRVGSFAVVVLIALVEFRWAWRGAAIFALLWPHQLLIKFILERDVSQFLHYIPEILDWPCAAGLTLAICCRQLRTIPPDPIRVDGRPGGMISQFIPAVFYLFAGITLLSALAAFPRLANAPASWNVQPPNYRHLLSVGYPASLMRLVWVALPMIVNALFAVILLRSVLFERHSAKKSVLPLYAFMVSMVLAGVFVVWQIRGQWHWHQFDNGPPSGPFSNRNAVAPMLFLAACVAASIAFDCKSRLLKAAAVLLALALGAVSIATGSRNAALLVGGLMWSGMLIGASFRRAVLSTVLPLALVFYALLWMPLPKASGIEVLHRSIDSIGRLRAGNWDEATSYRTQLWKTAFHTWSLYPVLGSGPGTYYLFTTQVPETRNDKLPAEGVARIVAHSTPINLLSEIGLFGALSWVFLWVAVPCIWIMRRWKADFVLIGLLLLGVSNLLDTPWYMMGGMTLAALWLAAAGSRSLSASH